MSVQHFPRNSSISLPIDVPLYNNVTPLTGEAANLALRVICLDNGYTFDNTDGQFRTSPALPTINLTPYTDYTNNYFTLITQSNWPRAHYRARILHSTSGTEYDFDFTLGIFTSRGLGYSAVYVGGVLTLSMWIEEEGVVQNDYLSLANCQIMDASGNMLADGNLGTNSSPNGGVFSFENSVSLQPGSAYSFRCDAMVAAAATRGNMTFTLQAGLARP